MIEPICPFKTNYGHDCRTHVRKARPMKYPTMKTKIVKLLRGDDLRVDATIEVDTGKPLVALGSKSVEDVNMSPSEAEHLSRALAKAAAVARAKMAHARQVALAS